MLFGCAPHCRDRNEDVIAVGVVPAVAVPVVAEAVAVVAVAVVPVVPAGGVKVLCARTLQKIEASNRSKGQRYMGTETERASTTGGPDL